MSGYLQKADYLMRIYPDEPDGAQAFASRKCYTLSVGVCIVGPKAAELIGLDKEPTKKEVRDSRACLYGAGFRCVIEERHGRKICRELKPPRS